MKKYFLMAGAILMLAVAARADQLAYNSLDISKLAVAAIKPDSVLVSYCSICDDTSVEVWQVRKAVITTTNERKLYEISIFGKQVFRSNQKFDKGKWSEPTDYKNVDSGKCGQWFLEPIDLAYIYVPTADGSFQNLAKLLNLEAKVKVDKINLPENLTSQAQEKIAATIAEAAAPEQADE